MDVDLLKAIWDGNGYRYGFICESTCGFRGMDPNPAIWSGNLKGRKDAKFKRTKVTLF